MENNLFNLNEKIYSNNNNILVEIVNDLHQLMNSSKDNLVIKTLGLIINKMNYIIKENQKNLELIRKDILSLHKKFDNLSIKGDSNIQELQQENGKYIGPVVNGLAEGRGVWFGNKEHSMNERYEGDFRNNKKEGKGVYFWPNGKRYEGDFRNGKLEGKGVYFFANGDSYEGDFRNGKREGRGIYYFNDGDRMMGDWINDKKVGTHVRLTKNGKVEIENYSTQ